MSDDAMSYREIARRLEHLEASLDKRLEGVSESLKELRVILGGAEGIISKLTGLTIRTAELEKDVDRLQAVNARLVWTLISAIVTGAVGLGFLLVRAGMGME